MHRRPKLHEAINVLQKLSSSHDDCLTTLQDYDDMCKAGNEFTAGRMVVDIVDHYYHILDTKGIAHG